MCFDISYALQGDVLEERFHAKFEDDENYVPVYHVSAFSLPDVPVITNESSDTIKLLKWGLIPFWVKNEESAEQIRMKTFNARTETLFEKPSFKYSIKKRRCLVLVDGFYEWREVGGKNYPYYIRMADKRAFAIAGIWDAWKNKETEQELRTFSIITTRANPLLEKIHNKKKRMPALLNPEDEKRWLAEGLGQSKTLRMLEPIDDSVLEAYPISKRISFREGNTNVPEIRERYEYEELRTQQTRLFL